MKQPESVYQFYASSCSQPLADDLSCCKTHIQCLQDGDNCDIEEYLNEGNVGEDDNGGDDFLSFNQQYLDDIDESFEKVSKESTQRCCRMVTARLSMRCKTYNHMVTLCFPSWSSESCPQVYGHCFTQAHKAEACSARGKQV